MQGRATKRRLLQTAVAMAALGGVTRVAQAFVGGPEEVAIWPDGPPSAKPLPSPETMTTLDTGWREISVIKNVSKPTVTIYPPASRPRNGPAMIVLPGGAFSLLAWDVEGTELAQFLASRGITAFVLKYRVSDTTPEGVAEYARDPTPANMFRLLAPKRLAAVADAMQAVRFVRGNARRYGIDPKRVGMMGFSAGAITTLGVLHKADPASAPNIAAPIYGNSMEDGAPLNTPPLFLALARDDGLFTPAQMKTLEDTWRKAGAPAESHIFESGGHGFGLGRPGTDSMRFSGLFEAWLRARGFIGS